MWLLVLQPQPAPHRACCWACGPSMHGVHPNPCFDRGTDRHGEREGRGREGRGGEGWRWRGASAKSTICVRQAQGYCCVQYQLCADQTNPFTLDRTLIAADVIKGLVDSSCTLDYVAIPGKSLLILCRCSYLPKHWYLMRSFMLFIFILL